MRLLLAALLLAAPLVAAAQDYRTSILYAAPADTAPSGLAYVPSDTVVVGNQRHIVFPILGGAVGGVVGMYGGLIVGASIENDPYSDDITPGMALGFVAGEMLMLPVGVHLGNGRKGSFLADLGVSTVIGTGAILLTTVSDTGVPLLVGALAQYGAVVAVERVTARKRMVAKARAQAHAP
jgi:hypothetical protein